MVLGKSKDLFISFKSWDRDVVLQVMQLILFTNCCCRVITVTLQPCPYGMDEQATYFFRAGHLVSNYSSWLVHPDAKVSTEATDMPSPFAISIRVHRSKLWAVPILGWLLKGINGFEMVFEV